MQRFARVFFQVSAHQAHGLFLGHTLDFGHEKFHCATLHHRDLKLADLVALGQIRVEVILARKNALRRDVRANGKAELNGPLHGTLVHHWQGAGQSEVHGAGLCIGLGTKGCCGAAEDLAGGGQLGVCLKADDDFITGHQWAGRAALLLGFKCVDDGLAHGQNPVGRTAWKSVACWKRWAALSSRASWK